MAAEERWYFSRDQLENTPSKKCGIDPEKELSYRQQAANFIQDMGQRLQVSQLCINTSIVYMHRFYMFHSFQKFHRNAISTCALFLAAKVEEQSRKLEHVIKVAHMCLHRDAPTLDTKSEAYLEQCQELVINENIMLQTLGFDVAIDHPHTHVVKCCQLVRGGWQSSHQHHASKELAQTSYVMATNSLHLTTMCLQYKPTVVACVCIHLACKWSNWEIPKSSEGKRWFWYVDKSVTEELLEELTAEFLAILDRCPNRMKRKMLSYSGMERMPDPGNYDRRSNADMDGSNRGSPNASGSSSSGASTSRGDRGDHYSGPMPALVRDNLFGGKAGAPSSSHARPTNAVDRNGGPAPSSSCADRKPQTHKGPAQNHPSRPHASANSSASTSAGPAAKHAAATVAANALSSPTLTDFPPSSQNSADNLQQQQPPPVVPASGNSAVKKLKPSSKEYRAGAATTSADSEKPLKQQQQQHHHQPPKPHGHHQGNHVGRAQRPPPAAKPHILTPSPPTPRDEEPFPAPSMDLSSPPPRTAEAPSMATPPTPLLPVACEVPAAAKADNHRKREREESAGRPPPAADPLRRHEARDAKERQTRPHKSKTPPAIPPTPEPQKPAAAAQVAQPPQQPPVAVRPDARRAEQDISNISRTIAPASHHVPPQQQPPPPATATVNPAARNSSSSLNETPPQPPHSRLQPQAPDANKAAAAPPPLESPAAVPRTPHQSSKKEKRHKSKSRDRDKERSHERREPAPLPSLVTTPIKLTIPKDRITAAAPAAGGPKRTLEPPSPGSLKLKISKEKLNSTPPVVPAVPVAAALPPQPPPPPAEPVAPVAASLKIKITKDRSGAMGAYNLSVPAAAMHDSRKRERPEDAEEPRQPPKAAKQSARAGRRGSGGDHGDVPPSSNTRSAGGYPPQGMMPHPQPPPHMQQQQQQPRGRKGGGKPGMGMHPPYRHPQPGGYPPGYGPQFYQYPPGPPPPAMPGYFMHPGHQGHPGGEYQHPGDYDYHRHQQPYFNQFQPPPMRPGMGFQHPPPHPHPHLMQQQQQPPRPMHPLPPREPPLPREPPPAIPPPPPPE